MGTYGVTHVKKDNKVIAFSDSYDGYMSGGMGESNLLCIKYLSTPILRKLFDEFTASTKVPVEQLKSYRDENVDYDDNDVDLSQRQIEDVLYRVKEQTKDPEAVEWMENVLRFDIRASICGFAPLLYLNINNHYGRDYNYANYTVDLDSEEFVFYGFKVPFDKIRSASKNALSVFCSDKREFLPKGVALNDKTYLFDESFINQNPERFTQIMDAYLSIDEQVLNAYFQKLEEERQAYLARSNPNTNLKSDNQELKLSGAMAEDNDFDDEDEYIGGYSIHNASVSGSMVRSIKALMERLKSVVPESAFLMENSDWGTDETHAEGGFRIFSTMSGGVEQNIHQNFVRTLENSFKVRFNIFSSSGKWSKDVEANEDNAGIGSFFAEVVPGPEKSLFSLQEIEQQFSADQEQRDMIFKNVNPYLSIHGAFSEVRELILNKSSEDFLATPFIWLQIALLYRDREVFSAVYPDAKTLLAQQEPSLVKQVKTKYLKALSDSETIHNVVDSFAKMYGKSNNLDDGFVDYLKSNDFFKDLEEEMNSSEKAKYVSQNNSGESVKSKKFK